MDPLTQGSLGASLAQSSSTRATAKLAAIVGFLAGMAADLDFLIRSETDPLLFLEYHRQFTHSLVFIPIGALFVAVLFHLVFTRRRGIRFARVYQYSFLGYATHAIIDACTSYGTQLFWPFSDIRISWNQISIIDPLLTAPLLLLVLLATLKRRPLFARLGFIWVVSYLLAGLYQHQRAVDNMQSLAESRGHQVERYEVKPSFANILLWKSIYEYDGNFYIDAIHVSTKTRIYTGKIIAKLNIKRDLPWIDMRSQQAKDIERFRWFSNDYLALKEGDPFQVVDMRYSMMPDEARALWGIQLDPQSSIDKHAGFDMYSDARVFNSSRFFSMLTAN